MPPKEKPSKKNALKKKDQAIEDRTFGLKNKNKSAKVQGFIQRKTIQIAVWHFFYIISALFQMSKNLWKTVA